jgi:hypothetical protein
MVKAARKIIPLKWLNRKASRGKISEKEGKKGSKKGIIDDTQGLHDRNDFRKEYRLSTQRYLQLEENHD